MSLRSAAAVASLATVALLLGGCGSDDGADQKSATDAGATTSCTYAADGSAPAKEVDPPAEDAPASGTVALTMATSVGDLGLTLDAAAAPCTVNSFVSLAEQGYFDDTSCHRLTTQGIHVLQCGDPTGTGTGGPGYTIQDEVDGSESYPAGTLAMARTQAPDSGGSQFFIVYGDTPLPPDYTVFGTVDDAGLKAIEKVAGAGTDEANGPGDGHPLTPVDIRSVTVG
ncbi:MULTISPECIES: peptidylprolyl isomerase [unclassified Nocardioides]|uniref:peptidylprolyl isomerase n=1 Tax=unclassified Nocardioides TaxID=2615069 RepID=UPI0000EB61DE|nr:MULTISPECIES: peptidylprolyl isomerase [unclassified Nocardioides]ABL82193.1 peptidyl-prolyl cis-trans isomerase, cyclophilin type [Nocardioides sp. JS614]